MSKGRHRVLYAVSLLLVILAGLASRRFRAYLPDFIAAYAGDTLWALAAFVFIALLFPRRTTAWVTSVAVVVCLLDELSQLYHAPWIDAVRDTTPGALLLGHGFLWSDLVCYAVGVALGALGEQLARLLSAKLGA